MDAAVPLPIDAVLGEIGDAVTARRRVVVAAAPGSGKTTRVPNALSGVVGGRVLVLEPRRVAARAMAHFLAGQRGEPVGGFIGLTTRDERRTSARTRIEFVTEGILTRRLQRDPELAGVDVVIFDEFHERSLSADTGLALVLDTAGSLRPDLAVVVMSATLDVAATAGLLGGATVVQAPGAAHPVTTRYLPMAATTPIEPAVAEAVRQALADGPGDVLVFLAGAAEIRRVEQRLATTLPPDVAATVDIRPLHGQLTPAVQDRALAPSPAGRRKVVLATNIAETSLTVDGVRVVVDSGLVRRVRTSRAGEGTGRFGQLVTERVSQAEADQRRGRAGRQGPGRCYRLWAERDHTGLRPAPRPEILESDLTGLALDLAGWGVADPATLAWLDPPPPDAVDEGRRTLRTLGLLDRSGRLTAEGRAVLQLGLEPRAGAVVLAGNRLGGDAPELAAALAALLEEGDVLTGGAGRRSADLGLRLDAVVEAGRNGGALPPGIDLQHARRDRVRARAARIAERARRLGRADRPDPDGGRANPGRTNPGRTNLGRTNPGRTERLGPAERPGRPGPTGRAAADDIVATLLLAGLSDRLAHRRPDGSGRFALRHGGGVRVDPADPLARAAFIVVADAGGAAPGGSPPGVGSGPGRQPSTARSAADLVARLAFEIPIGMLPAGERVVTVRWDPSIGDGGDVSARLEERLDALVLSSGPLALGELRPTEAIPALFEGIRRHGIKLLGHAIEAESLRLRIAFCRRMMPEQNWPDLGEEALLVSLEEWLTPWLGAARRRRDLAAIDLREVWTSLLDPAARRAIDRLAPARMTVPTGRSVTVDYGAERPTLAVKLQELFGLQSLPPLAEGRQRLVVQLLSPAGRPVAVTDDLERFWTGAYLQVRGELRGRYPRHPWPTDPLSAQPTAATNRRSR